MTIGSFIGTVLKNSNLADWNKEDIYWDTISINDHKVTIVNGAISPVVFGNLISTLIGQSPASAVILSAVVLQICTDAQLQALQCDPCLAQQAICTSSGPVCVDNQYCPSLLQLHVVRVKKGDLIAENRIAPVMDQFVQRLDGLAKMELHAQLAQNLIHVVPEQQKWHRALVEM